jgi:seryl-tRNA synthetase
MDVLSNSYATWTKEDDKKLKDLYCIENLDCIDIGLLFKRTPRSIAARLQKLDIVKNRFETRGYNEYKQSELYKSVCDNKKKKIDSDELKYEVNDMKQEIRDIRKSIDSFGKKMDKMFEMIESIYEFEK